MQWIIIPLEAEGAELVLVADEGTEVGETLLIALAVEPQMQVSAFGVLLKQMLLAALV